MHPEEPQAKIWFKRSLFSYTPCHWKDYAVMTAAISLALSASMLVLPADIPLSKGGQDFVRFGFLAELIIGLEIFAWKHSRPK